MEQLHGNCSLVDCYTDTLPKKFETIRLTFSSLPGYTVFIARATEINCIDVGFILSFRVE